MLPQIFNKQKQTKKIQTATSAENHNNFFVTTTTLSSNKNFTNPNKHFIPQAHIFAKSI